MGSMSLMHWVIVLAIVLVLFGAGKLPRMMGDFAKGIKAFKAGMKEEEEAEAEAAAAPAGLAAAGHRLGRRRGTFGRLHGNGPRPARLSRRAESLSGGRSGASTGAVHCGRSSTIASISAMTR